MRTHYRAIALAATLGIATVAFAQAGNPNSRGGPDRDPFASGSITSGPRADAIGRNSFGQSGLSRAQPRSTVVSVTPVPEPSQWAMMLAGLVAVGLIVRRNSKRK